MKLASINTDRLFPSQDTMPKGSFGNLIALPLQKGPREQGNSMFLNELFKPYYGSVEISRVSPDSFRPIRFGQS